MPYLYGLLAGAGAYYALRYHVAWPVIFLSVEQALATGAIKFDAADQRASGITQAGFAARTANTYLLYAVNFGSVAAFIAGAASSKTKLLAPIIGSIVGIAAGAGLAYAIGAGYLK